MRPRLRFVAALLLVAAIPVTGVGCAQGQSGSRHALYESIDDLAGDSAVIVVGSVSDSREGTGADPATISTVTVERLPVNPNLGQNLDGESGEVAVGDTLEVRQSAGAETPDAGILRTGEEYLLFLTPSMLPGDDAAQYFITGAVAGLYQRDGSEFRRVVSDTGDDLPDTIAIAGSPTPPVD